MNTKRDTAPAHLLRPGKEFRGVTKLARRLGCSQPHLSLVLHGKRVPGKALAAKLRKMGISLPEDNA
jgi:transcriptional regulator with XRE-family HTH domain